MARDYVTHDEFERAMGAIKKDFDRIDDKIEDVRQDTKSSIDDLRQETKRGFEQVMTILEGIDSNIKELRTLEPRVEYVERVIAKLP